MVKPPQKPIGNIIANDESELEFLIDQPRAKPINSNQSNLLQE